MSYKEEDGKVILTLDRSDYEMLLLCLGMAAGWAIKEKKDSSPFVELVNRINEGNPDFIPYQVREKK